MTKADLMASSAQTQAAAGWVARLGGEPGEADWLEFEGWLNAAPANRAAYDRVLALSLAVDHQAGALTDLLEGLDLPVPARAPVQTRGARLWIGSGLMAVAAVAVTFAVMNPQRDIGHTDSYSTVKGERRDVTLSDGTKVALNTNTSISVTMKRGTREITLASGEAAFQVIHNENRPFVVHAGDRVLRDLGTDFDVVHQNGDLVVTVREGKVAVQRAGKDETNLTGGMRLEHHEGAANSTVRVADTDATFAWRSGRLIYRDRTLSEIAADLNRYGEDQINVSPTAAALKFSGVLTIDNQSAMVDRLTALLPVTSRRRDGVITLSELNNAR